MNKSWQLSFKEFINLYSVTYLSIIALKLARYKAKKLCIPD